MKIRSCIIILLVFISIFESTTYADITEKQGEDIALFAQKFIEKGNTKVL